MLRSHKGADMRGKWDLHLAENKAIEEAGTVEVRQVGSRYQLVAAYKVGFPTAAREIRGKWRRRSRCWSFPLESRAKLIALIERFHGAEKVPEWMKADATEKD